MLKITTNHFSNILLDSNSAGNVLQLRSVTTERFVRCLGKVSAAVMQELPTGLILCVDSDPESNQ